jgi:hypothetical protein
MQALSKCLRSAECRIKGLTSSFSYEDAGYMKSDLRKVRLEYHVSSVVLMNSKDDVPAEFEACRCPCTDCTSIKSTFNWQSLGEETSLVIYWLVHSFVTLSRSIYI